MFTFDQIRELIELVARYRLHGLEIDRSGFRIRIEGEPAAHFSDANAVAAMPVAAAAAVREVTLGGPRTEVQPAAAAPERVDLHVVTSPIVGTFYASSSPESPAFVRTGDRVRKGQVICIVEAMKLMNEIECDADGVVTEIYPKNAQPVEYGEALFGLRAD